MISITVLNHLPVDTESFWNQSLLKPMLQVEFSTVLAGVTY